MSFDVRQMADSCEKEGSALLTKATTTTIPEAFQKSQCSNRKAHLTRSKHNPYKYSFFDHAVEISIAASEALLIHELLETEEGSAVVPASGLLDVSLKMKQARLQWVTEDMLSNDQPHEGSDHLSDLDDSEMFDAFVDVGLCAASSGACCASDSIMSRVNESPLTDLETVYKFGHSNVPIPEVAVGCCVIETYSAETQDIDTNHLKALQQGVRYREDIDGGYPESKCNIGKIEPCPSGQEIAKFEVTEPPQQAGFMMPVEPNSRPLQAQLNANISQSRDISATDDCQLKHPSVSRYDSCWFGGWTRKMDDCRDLTLDSRKYSEKALIAETSSLSESVDVPDECSYVDQKESKHLTSVQAGTSFDLLASADIFATEMKISHEINKHSSSLITDPLCSVVPCSLQSETQPMQTGHLFLISGELLDKNDPSPASRNGTSTTPYVEATNITGIGIKCQPSIGNLNDGVTGIQTACEKSAKCGAGFLTSPPEQEVLAFQYKGLQRHGVCRDKKLGCSATQRLLDAFPLKEKSHVPSAEATGIQNLQRKRVHFKVDEADLEQSKCLGFQKRKSRNEFVSSPNSKNLRTLNLQPERETCSQEVKKQLTNYCPRYEKKLIFYGLEFLLTGFPKNKEKEVELLIERYGGIVLSDIPTQNSKGNIRIQSRCQKLPVVICFRKVKTTKFLFGCAVNACILKIDWILDSISAGSVLEPEKYMIFPNQADEKHTRLRIPRAFKLVFEGVGIMVHGKHSFCTKLSRLFMCGGGRVFKTLQRLFQSSEEEKLIIQAVVAEDISTMSRHLKHCAMERNLPIVSPSWIVNSLHAGRLLPFAESDYKFHKPMRKTSQDVPLSLCLIQEI